MYSTFLFLSTPVFYLYIPKKEDAIDNEALIESQQSVVVVVTAASKDDEPMHEYIPTVIYTTQYYKVQQVLYTETLIGWTVMIPIAIYNLSNLWSSSTRDSKR